MTELIVELPTSSANADAPTSLPQSISVPDTEPNAEAVPVQASWTPICASGPNRQTTRPPTTSEQERPVVAPIQDSPPPATARHRAAALACRPPSAISAPVVKETP